MKQEVDWSKKNIRKVGSECNSVDVEIDDPGRERKIIEPWLTAVFQSEHFSLLLGNGITTAVAKALGVNPISMGKIAFNCDLEDKVNDYADQIAEKTGRGVSNIEDQIRAASALIEGLKILKKSAKLQEWNTSLDNVLKGLMGSILNCEKEIGNLMQALDQKGREGRRLLESFILSFASRAASRERLHIFSINYDRLIEYGCDLLGLHVLDRFVGILNPIFRSSRLDIDIHYNPPGIRGEPRFLEGVIKLTKLHGSVDWRMYPDGLRKNSIPFGSDLFHPDLPKEPNLQAIIYPNASKDTETLEYPYAELFRDFSAALCRPNSALVTYGYSFGDDHINRIILDMLTIPSTHLVVIAYDDDFNRIRNFFERVSQDAQITLLIGNHYGMLSNLVDNYLPKPAIDLITCRKAGILERRGENSNANAISEQEEDNDKTH